MQYEELNQKYGTVAKEMIPVLNEAVTQAVQADVAITGDDPASLTADFAPTHEFPLLRVVMGSTTDSAYEHQFLLDKSLAGLISSWMVGGEPPEEVGAEQLDAVKEMVAQVLGQLQAAFDGEEHAFTAGSVEVSEVAAQEDLGLPAEGLVATYRFTRGEEEQEHHITHVVQGDALSASEEETPAEETAGEETSGEEAVVGEETPGEETPGEETPAEEALDMGEDFATDLVGDEEGLVGTGDMDDLFGDTGDSETVIEASPADFEEFGETGASNGKGRQIDMLLDVELDVTVELGRKIMYVEDILRLGKGSVVELDKLAGEPVDILVNGKKLAEGEVVVIEDHFGVRLTHLMDARARIKSLGRGG